MSVQDEIQEFLGTISVSARTKDLYGAVLTRFVGWTEGSLPESDIMAQQYVIHREALGLKPNTLALDCHALNRYLVWKGIPNRRLERRDIEMNEPRPITLDQLRALLAACDLSLIKLVAVLMYDTGARISEVLTLAMDGIDWEGFLTVRRKGGRVERTPLSEWGLGYLEKWVQNDRQGEHRLLFGIMGELNGQGRPKGYQRVWKEIKNAAKRAGLPPDFTDHDIRHSRAVHMRQAGDDWVVIADQLGHVNPATTMRIYGRHSPEILREVRSAPQVE